MAIIVGDIHGNVEKAERFLRYRPDQPHVALGDYVDSFTESFEAQLRTVRLLVESDAVLLWGNHDLHYLGDAPWRCSGYQPRHADKFAALFEGLLRNRRLVAAHWVDGWLCTHAGLPEGGSGLTPHGCCRGNTGHIAACLNEHFFRALEYDHFSPIFNIPIARGGDADYGGIFWFDPFREKIRPDPTWRQLFGHSEQKNPVVTADWICLDTTNSDAIWIYDTEVGALCNLRTPEEQQALRAGRHKLTLDFFSRYSGGF